MLVGRDHELETIGQVLDQVDTGEPGALVVSGEPGIGKSRLLAELAQQSDARGHLVLIGRAAEYEHDLPFGPFIDALDDYLVGAGLEALDSLGDAQLGELAAVLPALGGRGRAPTPIAEERYRVYRSLRALLAVLAGARPLVLCLDDLHWADPATTEAVVHVWRHRPAGRVLVAGALRPAQAAPSLSRALDAAVLAEDVRLLDLGALSRADAELLLDPEVDVATRDALYQESGGNPFYLEQLGRLDRRRTSTAFDPRPTPQRVVAAIGEEVRSLDERSRAALEAASVAGDPFDPDLVAAIAGLDVHDVLAAFDLLHARDLIRSTDVPRRFRFRHPLVRRAVYEACGDGWRMGAHGRAAAALAARGGSTATRAHHVERSASIGDLEAVSVLRDAAQSVEFQAPSTAADWYGAALRILPETTDPNERLGLLAARATALGTSGRLEEAHTALMHTLAVFPPSPDRAQLVAFCAGLEHLLGRHRDARARLLHELEALDDPRSVARVPLTLGLAIERMWSADWAGMREWASDAHATAVDLGAPTLLAMSSAVAACAEVCDGDMPTASARIDEAAELIDGLDDQAAAEAIDAFFFLGYAEVFSDRFAASLSHFERGLSLSRSTGQGRLLLGFRAGTSGALVSLGRLAEAKVVLEEALDTAQISENPLGHALTLIGATLTALHCGDLPTALRHGEASARLTESADPDAASVAVPWAYAVALEQAGEPERCIDMTLARAGGPELKGLAAGARNACYEALVRAEVARGRVDAAKQWAERAADLAEKLELPVSSAQAARSEGEVLLVTGHAESARERARSATRSAEHGGAPIEALRSRLLEGRCAEAAGARADALDIFNRVAADAEGIGADGYAAEAARQLRRLGRRVYRRRSGEGGGGLSPREREVAELVASGLTNRQIADRLYVGERTVDTHVSRILAKLDVASRSGVGRALERAQTRA